MKNQSTVIVVLLMSPTMFILFSSILHPDNSYNIYAFVSAVILFLLGLVILFKTGKKGLL